MANGGDGAKAFGGLVAVVAVIGVTTGVIFGVTSPMSERIQQLERAVDAHTTMRWHPGAGETVPALEKTLALYTSHFEKALEAAARLNTAERSILRQAIGVLEDRE